MFIQLSDRDFSGTITSASTLYQEHNINISQMIPCWIWSCHPINHYATPHHFIYLIVWIKGDWVITKVACKLSDKVNSSTGAFHLHSPAAILTLASIWVSRSFDLRSTLAELMFSRWPYKTQIARGSVTVDTHGLRYVTLPCFGFTEQPDKTTFGNVNMLKLHGSRRARPGVSNTISFNPICCESSLGRKRTYICLGPSAVLCAGLCFAGDLFCCQEAKPTLSCWALRS